MRISDTRETRLSVLGSAVDWARDVLRADGWEVEEAEADLVARREGGTVVLAYDDVERLALEARKTDLLFAARALARGHPPEDAQRRLPGASLSLPRRIPV
jgi:hypothetical protein